ncbi:hypothetical protein GCM10010236_59200 [Streptomyces eurythermus]|nr:hypothetical protein GCM10010236_59200 [Streptomyces eurythermus]
MGHTILGRLDEVLGFIGINFPNVDEDDYREMADAMRDFADQFEGARLFADACDALAEIIFWMKTKAEAELAVMAGSVGLSIGLAPQWRS